MDEQSESSEESEEEKPPEEDKEEEEEKKAPTPQEKKRRKGGLAPLRCDLRQGRGLAQGSPVLTSPPLALCRQQRGVRQLRGE